MMKGQAEINQRTTQLNGKFRVVMVIDRNGNDRNGNDRNDIRKAAIRIQMIQNASHLDIKHWPTVFQPQGRKHFKSQLSQGQVLTNPSIPFMPRHPSRFERRENSQMKMPWLKKKASHLRMSTTVLSPCGSRLINGR